MGGIGPVELLILLVFLIGVAVVVVVIVLAVSSSRNATVQRPLVQPQYGAEPVPQGQGSIEATLAELDSLRSRGVINDDEYTTARARALGGHPAS